MTHALAMSKNMECYTPWWLVEKARAVLGGIDLDPASCEEANKTVRATLYYDKESDGLTEPWFGRVFVNPPGDPRGKLPQAFWAKLAAEVADGRALSFIWIAFNVSQLRTLQGTSRWLLNKSHVCVLSKRVRFTGDSPTKDNAVLYYGSSFHLFDSEFQHHGSIWRARGGL